MNFIMISVLLKKFLLSCFHILDVTPKHINPPPYSVTHFRHLSSLFKGDIINGSILTLRGKKGTGFQKVDFSNSNTRLMATSLSLWKNIDNTG